MMITFYNKFKKYNIIIPYIVIKIKYSTKYLCKYVMEQKPGFQRG